MPEFKRSLLWSRNLGSISAASIAALRFLRKTAEEHDIKIIELGFPPSIIARVRDLSTEVKKEIDDMVGSFRATCHTPMLDLSSLNEKKRKENVDEMIASIEFSLDRGVTQFVMHLAASGMFSFIPWPKKNANTELIQRAGHRSFEEIMARFEGENIILGLENLTGHEPAFQDPKDLSTLFRKNVGLTLDTVHAISWNLDPVEMVGLYKEHLVEVHLTDGTGQGEVVKHYALGKREGRVPLNSLLHKLEEIEFGGPVIIEVDNREDLEKSLKWLQNR